MHTTRRLTTGAVLIAVLALFAGACSSDDSAGDTTTTAEQTTTTEADGTDADTDTDTTTDTVSDADFESAVADVSDAIEATGGDTCGLLDILNEMDAIDLPDPSTSTQVMAALGLVVRLFNAIADAAPPEYAVQAETIRTTLTDFQAEAEANDYDPEWFADPELDPFASEEATAAINTFYDVATDACSPATTTTAAG